MCECVIHLGRSLVPVLVAVYVRDSPFLQHCDAYGRVSSCLPTCGMRSVRWSRPLHVLMLFQVMVSLGAHASVFVVWMSCHPVSCPACPVFHGRISLPWAHPLDQCQSVCSGCLLGWFVAVVVVSSSTSIGLYCSIVTVSYRVCDTHHHKSSIRVFLGQVAIQPHIVSHHHSRSPPVQQ